MFQLNDDIYRELHQQLMLRPTRREREQEDKVFAQNQSSSTEIQQQKWNKKEIRIPFTFESGPKLELKRQLRLLWAKYYNYQGSPMNDVVLKFNIKNNKSLNQLLVKKKPAKSMLVNDNATVSN